MKIELTDNEIEVVMKALHHFANAPHSIREGVCIDEINEIADDIREQDCRRDDGWNDAVPEAAAEFIQAGIDAREQVKGTSRAAQRRQEQVERMMKGTATPTDSDTWPLNDPADW